MNVQVSFPQSTTTFIQNSNYENLRTILSGRGDSLIQLVIDMVELVSASKNGDSIPDRIKDRCVA